MVEKTYLERAHWPLVSYCDKIFRNRNEIETPIYEVCESTWHECSTKYEVKKTQRRQCCLESRLNYLEGYGTYGNNERKKTTWKGGVHSMKKISEKAMEVNN